MVRGLTIAWTCMKDDADGGGGELTLTSRAGLALRCPQLSSRVASVGLRSTIRS